MLCGENVWLIRNTVLAVHVILILTVLPGKIKLKALYNDGAEIVSVRRIELIVRCANCHRIKTFERCNSWRQLLC